MTRDSSSLAANDQFVVPRLLTAVAASMVGFGVLSLLFGRGDPTSEGRRPPRRATLEAPGLAELPASAPRVVARPGAGPPASPADTAGAGAEDGLPR